MILKKVLKPLAMASVLFASLYAGELKVENKSNKTVEVTVRAKSNDEPTSQPYTVTQTVVPGKTVTVTLEENHCGKGATFSVIATPVVPSPALSVPSNECMLTGCQGKVVIVNSQDGQGVVCSVTETTH